MKISIKLFTLLFASSFLFACQPKEEKEEEVLRPVRYQVVGKSDSQNQRSFNGVAVASEETELSFRSSGVITEIDAKVGKVVKKGELIAKLDNVQAKLAYEQSISSLNSAKSSMTTAKSSLDRSRKLYEKGSASLSEYEKAKNNFQSASDQFESAKRNKGIQQSQIDYGYIYAPADGVIAVSNKEINENVSAGEVIAVLNSGEGIDVEIGLPESVINKVEIGMSAFVSFSTLELNGLEATVFEVAQILDATASTFPVKLNITNPASSIKPGMISKVTFNFGNSVAAGDNGITIPVKAVGEDGEGNFVLLIESTDDEIGTVKKQHVTLGDLNNEGFKVISGITEGQKIATSGLQTLLEGQKVSL